MPCWKRAIGYSDGKVYYLTNFNGLFRKGIVKSELTWDLGVEDGMHTVCVVGWLHSASIISSTLRVWILVFVRLYKWSSLEFLSGVVLWGELLCFWSWDLKEEDGSDMSNEFVLLASQRDQCSQNGNPTLVHIQHIHNHRVIEGSDDCDWIFVVDLLSIEECLPQSTSLRFRQIVCGFQTKPEPLLLSEALIESTTDKWQRFYYSHHIPDDLINVYGAVCGN